MPYFNIASGSCEEAEQYHPLGNLSSSVSQGRLVIWQKGKSRLLATQTPSWAYRVTSPKLELALEWDSMGVIKVLPAFQHRRHLQKLQIRRSVRPRHPADFPGSPTKEAEEEIRNEDYYYINVLPLSREAENKRNFYFHQTGLLTWKRNRAEDKTEKILRWP